MERLDQEACNKDLRNFAEPILSATPTFAGWSIRGWAHGHGIHGKYVS